MDLIIDCETLGIDPCNCAVINFAFVPFDFNRFISNPYTFEELLDDAHCYKLNVAQQVADLGYKVEADTLQFWRSLPADVRVQASPAPHDMSVVEFVEKFTRFFDDVPKPKRTWARGMNFDPVILKRLFRDAGKDLDTVIPYNGLRDTRTYLDTRFNFTMKTTSFIPGETEADCEALSAAFKEHDSRHDIALEVLRLQLCERKLVEE